MRRIIGSLILLVLTVPVASSQPATAPSIIAAERAFERGLRAFHGERFGAAHEAFSEAATAYEFHQGTTAAHLMAGKALLAAGDFEAAASTMTNFIARYPRSRYTVEARQVRRQAMERMREVPVAPAVTSLGIILPGGSGDAVFTQALFNGIRLAVDAHNDVNPDRPVRMIYRDSGSDASTASSAVSELARAGADVVIGPLYSEEAIAAATVAEREGLVLVTPLATDDRVSAGKRLVFQANPTFPVRGRVMARHALRSGLDLVGVAAVTDTYAEEMAVAFRDEFQRAGRSLHFDERLPRGEAWFQLSERLGAERIVPVDAVYFPITGAGADEHAAGALRGLDQMLAEAGGAPRVLGNSEWQNLQASRPMAERFGTVFTNDFFLAGETPELRSFTNRYFDLSGVLPDRLAFKGYDVATMLLPRIAEGHRGRVLADGLRGAGPHGGLAHRISFDGHQVNQHLYRVRFRGAGLELVP